MPYDIEIEKLKELKPKAIILSGGPSSVFDADSPRRSVKELANLAPVLGVCYGMQLIVHDLGGVVKPSLNREYGHNQITWKTQSKDRPQTHSVWMSHGDSVEALPTGFIQTAQSESGVLAAIESDRIWAVQFHPEVSHTEYGSEFLKSYAGDMGHVAPTWKSQKIIEVISQKLLEQVGHKDKILLGLSGGVDSTVAAVLLTQVFGRDRVYCVFVDNGLLRKNEYQDVLNNYKDLNLNVFGVDASQTFLDALKGVTDPEEKRKIIGRVFIDVFIETIKIKGINTQWLAQGTLYPDVIESISPRGSSVTIKSHHNVGGLPKELNLKLVEPFKELFKDEVRLIGQKLGIDKKLIGRHPFPGPGLAVRILGDVTVEKLEILRDCDEILISNLKSYGLYDKIWQAFCVLLPTKTVGVQGDARTYERTVVIRSVTSKDGMTADWYPFSSDFLRHLSNQMTNQVKGINRVVLDITSKPPGTIEWE